MSQSDGPRGGVDVVLTWSCGGPLPPSCLVMWLLGSAEMTTSTGAVYKTTNSGRNWKVRSGGRGL